MVRYNESNMSKDNNNPKETVESIHKIQRTGRAGMSYMVTLPKEAVKDSVGARPAN